MWDQAARWYDALVGPGAFRLLDLKKGARVLDLACGQGVFSRFLDKEGMKPVGLDISQELIQAAQKRPSKNIRYEIGDAAAPEILKDEQFDAGVCLLAVQNMKSLKPVLANVHRLLKPGGRFVMVMTHPCFRIPRQTHWGFDEERKIMYRRTDLYLSESDIPILTPPMAKSKVYTVTYHRPLQSYFDAVSGAGLVVDGMEEWTSHKSSQPGKRAKAENRARNEIPLFLALRALKMK